MHQNVYLWSKGLTVFQSNQNYSSCYSRFSWVLPVLGWGSDALICLAQGHSHEKPRQLDYESNTLPLSQVGPIAKLYCRAVLVKSIFKQQNECTRR